MPPVSTPPQLSSNFHNLFSFKFWLIPCVMAIFLVVVSRYNFILFHTLAVLFAIIVAMLMSVVAWQMYPFTRNNFLIYLGCGYFWVAVLDLVHTLLFEGMNVFDNRSLNPPVQFWLATRYLEAALILSSAWVVNYRLNYQWVFLFYGLVAGVIYVSIMFGYFPECYIEGQGLTPFKIINEYIIIVMLLLAGIALWNTRKNIPGNVLTAILLSIVLTMCAELAFTFYISMYSISIVIGHIFKLFSYWLIFMAMVRYTLQEPFQVMARDATTYDAIPEATIVTDQHGIIRQANNAASRFTKLPIDELVGKHCHDLFHSSLHFYNECFVCQSMIKGDPLDLYEIKIDGQGRWHDVSLSPVVSQESLHGIVQVIRDITPRKRIELDYRHSEAQVRLLLDSKAEAIYGVDPQGVCTFANSACIEMLGYKEVADLIGQDMHQLIRPGHFTGQSTRLDDCLIDKTITNISQYHVDDEILWRKDGSNFEVELWSSPIIDEQACIGAVVTFVDITARRIVERELETINELKNSIVENLPLVLYVKRVNDSTFVEWNKAMEELTGLAKADVLGNTDHSVDLQEYAPYFQNKDQEVLQGGAVVDIPEQQINSTQGVRLLYTRKVPIKNKYGDAQYILGISQDITESRKTEKDLRRSQKLDAIGELSGGIAHDFNNQLGVVLGYLELLGQGVEHSKKYSAWIDTAIQAARRCVTLTNQLLSFSRQKSLQSQLVDVNQLLVDCQFILAKAITPQIEVNYSKTDKVWPVLLDPGEFQDAVLNLALNARDAMLDGGKLNIETSNITLSSSDSITSHDIMSGDYVLISVRDSGLGMSKLTQERIFEPFYTTKLEGQGTGLGLPMVYGFIQRSHGHIVVESEMGRGTVFSLYFPRSLHKQRLEVGQEPQTCQLPTGKEAVLVVDDEPELTKLAQLYLCDLGYQVLIAKNGRDALTLFNENANIDLVFSDVVMPGGMSGYDLAEQVLAKRPDVQVLLTSGHRPKTNLSPSLKRCIETLLDKPYSKKDLAYRIREVLDGQPA